MMLNVNYMDNWEPKLKLFCALSAKKELIACSEKDWWSDEDPKEALAEIDSVISYLLNPKGKANSPYARIMLAPIAPFQEP